MSPERISLPGIPRSVTLLEADGVSSSDVLVERAKAVGYARGLQDGQTAQRDAAAEVLHSVAQALEAFGEQARADLARTSVELALAVSQRILRKQIELGEVDLESIVRESLRSASTERGPCVVHLHPADAQLLDGVPFRGGTEIRPDVEVRRGDVHVETAQGLLVREIDGILESIGERLLEDLP